MNTKTRSVLSAFSGLGLLILPAVSHAAVYEYDVTNPGASAGAGTINSIHSTYDNTTHSLTWDYTISTTPGDNLANGYWLVLSNGPNPKGISDQLPIVYVDASRSFDVNGNATGISPTVTAYAYNGVNANDSYSNPGVGLLTSLGSPWNASNSVSATGDAGSRTFDLTIDTSLLDSAASVNTAFTNAGQAFDASQWEGVGYGSQVGIWFHADDFGATDPGYNAQGYLTSFPIYAQSAYDTSYQGTTVVPEPSSALLVAFAGLVLVHRRPRRVRA